MTSKSSEITREVPALELHSVTASYGRLPALEPIDIVLPESGLVVVVGPNGAGKSTLVRTVAGLMRGGKGSIRLEGRDITRYSATRRARAGVVLVPEGRGTLPGLTVEENLLLAAKLGRAPLDWDDVSRRFPRLRERSWQNCASLSGGEMQMLTIAQAIAAHAHVLLLDEPSQGLAPLMVQEVYRSLEALNKEGMSILLIEQKSIPLWRVPNETIVLSSGHVAHRVKDATIAESELASLYMGSEE